MAIVEKVDGFFIPNVTLIGVGAAKAIPERIVYLNATKPLLVTDKGIVHTGILKQITDILDEAAMEYAIYDETVPNPTDINVEAGAELYRKEECDSLISIGGGTYCRYVPNTVSYGPVFPGQKEMAHQADEFISLEDLRKIAKIYAQTIYNLIA